MTNRRIFQSFAVAASLLAFATAANASPTTGCAITSGVTYDYETSTSVAAAIGTISAANTSLAQGGLTTYGNASCANTLAQNTNSNDLNQYGLLYSAGSSGASGLIELMSGAPISNYLLTITIQGTGQRGDIYQILVNNNALTRTVSGTPTTATSPVAYNASGGSTGTFSTVISGGNSSPIFISVTDLLQQYLGTGFNYTLPGTLPGGLNSENTGALVNSFDGLSQFTLTASLVPDPEPASLSIFALGSLALGAARRRKRARLRETAV